MVILGIRNCNEGIKKQFIRIKRKQQSSYVKSLTINAGGLSKSLSSTDKNSTTDLTISGKMDARDFVTMRDSMPCLINIDLSNVTIVSYIGSNGTDNTSSETRTYNANSIPQYAFYNPAKNGIQVYNSIIYGFINKMGKVLVKFQTIKDHEDLKFLRAQAEKKANKKI